MHKEFFKKLDLKLLPITYLTFLGIITITEIIRSDLDLTSFRNVYISDTRIKKANIGSFR